MENRNRSRKYSDNPYIKEINEAKVTEIDDSQQQSKMITIAKFGYYASFLIAIMAGITHYFLGRPGSVLQRMSYPLANMVVNIILRVLVEMNIPWAKVHFALVQSFVLMAALIESNLF